MENELHDFLQVSSSSDLNALVRDWDKHGKQRVLNKQWWHQKFYQREET